jgi:hypothetical protein
MASARVGVYCPGAGVALGVKTPGVTAVLAAGAVVGIPMRFPIVEFAHWPVCTHGEMADWAVLYALSMYCWASFVPATCVAAAVFAALL